MTADNQRPWVSLEVLFLSAMALVVAFGTYTTPQTDNDRSRFATAESLVERGTWQIDQSPFFSKETPWGPHPIIDRAVIDGRSYSTKPPLLSAFMGIEYALLKRCLSWDLDSPIHSGRVIWIITVSLVGIPFLTCGILFLRICGWYQVSPGIRFMGLVVLLLGSPLFVFARTLNNHVPAAALMLASLVLAIGLKRGMIRNPTWFLLTGLCAGSLPCLDLPGCFFSIALTGYLFYRFPRPQAIALFLFGAAAPITFHVLVTWHLTGGLLPIYLRPEYYQYQGSYWQHPAGIDALQEPKWVYFFHLCAGRKGLWILFPVMALPLGAWFATARRCSALLLTMVVAAILMGGISAGIQAGHGSAPPPLHPLGYAAVVVVTIFLLIWVTALYRKTSPTGFPEMKWFGWLIPAWVVFYVLTTHNYGGWAYGFRWFTFFVPAFLALALIQLSKMPSVKRDRTILVAVVLVSIAGGLQGFLQPWCYAHEWTRILLGYWGGA